MTDEELLDQAVLSGDTSQPLGAAELPGDVSGPGEVLETVEALADTVRPFLTTPFEEYTVTEGLLLLLLLLAVVAACVRLVKGGFSWL